MEDLSVHRKHKSLFMTKNGNVMNKNMESRGCVCFMDSTCKNTPLYIDTHTNEIFSLYNEKIGDIKVSPYNELYLHAYTGYYIVYCNSYYTYYMSNDSCIQLNDHNLVNVYTDTEFKKCVSL